MNSLKTKILFSVSFVIFCLAGCASQGGPGTLSENGIDDPSQLVSEVALREIGCRSFQDYKADKDQNTQLCMLPKNWVDVYQQNAALIKYQRQANVAREGQKLSTVGRLQLTYNVMAVISQISFNQRNPPKIEFYSRGGSEIPIHERAYLKEVLRLAIQFAEDGISLSFATDPKIEGPFVNDMQAERIPEEIEAAKMKLMALWNKFGRPKLSPASKALFGSMIIHLETPMQLLQAFKEQIEKAN